jgi:glycosyltransferase involved in cell wall biosynthesis
MKIAIFYHLAQLNDWEMLYQEQMQALIVSGLYDQCEFIHVGINGTEPLPLSLSKVRYKYNPELVLEGYTLTDLWNFCSEHHDYKVLYFHSKGVSWNKDNAAETNVPNLLFKVKQWRLSLEFFTIHKWKQNIQLLDQYDCVGSEFQTQTILGSHDFKEFHSPHFKGNFWWANSSYIRTLDPFYLLDETGGWTRWRSEHWIGTGNPKVYNWYNLGRDKTHYIDEYNVENYSKANLKMSNKQAKIVMITMFKNESKVMRRMLESCYKYIDFWVIQNNGSTDGTEVIVKEFFAEKGIPGVLYDVEEGWVNFGWNRDHLIRTCQTIDHGCDWILKMDCDETLEVDDNFDWSPLDNKNTESFHIAAVAGTAIYYRAWMYNANLRWGFNHDPCHETVYKIEADGSKNESFSRYDLPPGFRQIGFNEGQSWSDPAKFISHALILEEKMIKEGNMLTDLYHFWYIGKSYFDAIPSSAFPLKESQQREYARRTIYYFEQYVNYIEKTGQSYGIDEMSYMAMLFSAESHLFLQNDEAAIVCYKLSEKYAPRRNDHLFGLANIYKRLGRYEEMLAVTSRMMSPERKNPFPDYSSFIDTALYYDSPTGRVQELHNFALSKQEKPMETTIFTYSNVQRPRLFVVDNFYANPDAVREFALAQEFQQDLRWYKGLRTTTVYRPPGIKEAFERIIGQKITVFEEHGYNGVFQLCNAQDPQVYHYDQQSWAAMIYLTPNAPIESGTRLHRSRLNGTRDSRESNVDDAFNGDFYDGTKFDVVDSVANVYNRLIIMDARCIHSAGPYFGNNETNSRLTHLFFFD